MVTAFPSELRTFDSCENNQTKNKLHTFINTTQRDAMKKSHDSRFVTLSSNEIDALVEQKRKETRMARLLETRRQAKDQAAKLRSQYKEKKQEEQERSVLQSQQEWQTQRDARVKQLETEIEIASNQVGSAFEQARQWNEQIYSASLRNEAIKSECDMREKKRYKQAIHAQKYEQSVRREPQLSRENLRNQVRVHEDKLSRGIAIRVRDIASSSKSDVNSTSNAPKSIHQTTLSDIDAVLNAAKKAKRVGYSSDTPVAKVVRNY